jgi:hypothetical protein
MHCEGKIKLRSHNTSYCLVEVVTKAGLTSIHYGIYTNVGLNEACISNLRGLGQ